MSVLWKFTSQVPEERRNKLLAISSFREVIDRLVTGTVEAFTAERRRDPPCSGYVRASFSIGVGEQAFDLFFNSPVGYRAQYCISVERGREQNRLLIAALTPTCLRFLAGREEPGFPTESVLASLQGTDAKVWIPETEWPNVGEVHIEFQPWMLKMQTANEGGASD